MSQLQNAHCFVVLYAGRTVAEARVIAASSAPELVEAAARTMLGDVNNNPNTPTDPALSGRRYALEIITTEAG